MGWRFHAPFVVSGNAPGAAGGPRGAPTNSFMQQQLALDACKPLHQSKTCGIRRMSVQLPAGAPVAACCSSS